MTTTQDIIKTEVCEQIFQNGYPTTLENMHPFDFFMEADIDATVEVGDSPLYTEWNFEVASDSFENIRSIRGTMQSMYDDLERLKTSLFQNTVKRTMISKEEFKIEEDFYNFIQSSNATLHKQGTADEYATVLTVDAEVVF